MSQNPGPGEYELYIRSSKTPQYSFPKKKKEIIINNNLNYTVTSPGGFKASLENMNAFSIVNQASSKSEQEYNPDKSKKPGYPSINIDKKNHILEKTADTVPGPGAYTCSRDKISKSKIFR